MAVDVVIGLQRGDEGKGRIVDLIAPNYQVIARFNGGPNAGHTVFVKGQELVLHQVPSGISHPAIVNVIGNGTYVDPVSLVGELDYLLKAGLGLKVAADRLKISSTAHLILPHHIYLDQLREASEAAQGSTRRGIAYAAADKYQRHGFRVADIVDRPDELKTHIIRELEAVSVRQRQLGQAECQPEEEAKQWLVQAGQIKGYITDTVSFIHERLGLGERVLAEGAQAAMLDIDHGVYPFVTSSNCGVAGVISGLGIPPKAIDKIIGVFKAVQTHVGDGPFVTEISDATMLRRLRGKVGQVDGEYGGTTGRPRRVGYLDLVFIKHALAINGVNELVLTKLDAVPKFGETVKVALSYKLNGQAVQYPPGSLAQLADSQPKYETMPTWTEDIQAIRDFSKLPEAAKNYVNFIANQLNVPLSMLGVGPERDQIVINK